MSIPKIENIHQEVYNYAKENGHLDMNDWHKNAKIEEGAHCGTTHCRAGIVTFLAKQEGVKLENETSTLFAAMQIYKKSSSIKVSPVRFFETREVALADMERCAKEEVALSNPKS